MEIDTNGETRVISRKGPNRDSSIPVTIRPILTIINGAHKGTRFQLKQNNVIIGRGEDATIRLKDDLASRIHATITFQNMEFRIKDMNSANGTILNGSSVQEYALRHNDKVMIGETLLQFTIDRL